MQWQLDLSINLHLVPEREQMWLVTSTELLLCRLHYDWLGTPFSLLFFVSRAEVIQVFSLCPKTLQHPETWCTILRSNGGTWSYRSQDCNWSLECMLFWYLTNLYSYLFCVYRKKRARQVKINWDSEQNTGLYYAAGVSGRKDLRELFCWLLYTTPIIRCFPYLLAPVVSYSSI